MSERFTDPRDGKTYRTVKIGEQIWMAENLKYAGEDGCLGLYRDGAFNIYKQGEREPSIYEKLDEVSKSLLDKVLNKLNEMGELKEVYKKELPLSKEEEWIYPCLNYVLRTSITLNDKNPAVPLADLVREGVIGLMRARELYNSTKDVLHYGIRLAEACMSQVVINSYSPPIYPKDYEIYGRLYSWEEAMKNCPNGWHLPSKEEWQTLVDFAGGEEVASDFSALPDYPASWWSSSEDDSYFAYNFRYNFSKPYWHSPYWYKIPKYCQFPVRCIKNGGT